MRVVHTRYGEVDAIDGEGTENASLRAVARNLFCFYGGAIVVCVIFLIQSHTERAETELRNTLRASLVARLFGGLGRQSRW